MPNDQFSIDAIGRVATDEGGFALAIDEPYRPALAELDGFSHINVLWWCHLLDEPMFRARMVAEWAYRDAPEQIGSFARRSPARPNPIALSAVPVMSIDASNGIVRIPWIDADDGTPILDIKPYHPAVDRIREVSVPAWCASWPQWYEDSATFDWGAVFVNAQ